jgi:propionyl-CoA carboxylase alpha chain
MIAKLIAYGDDRDTAIERLQGALDGFAIAGVRHNVGFLAAIAGSERFRRGALSTDFIAEEFPNGFAPPAGPVDADRVILLAAVLAASRLDEVENPVDAASGAGSHTARQLTVLLDGRPQPVSIRREGGAYLIEGDAGSCLAGTDWRPGQPVMHLRVEDGLATAQIERRRGRSFQLMHAGVVRQAQVLPPRAAELLLLMPQKTPADTSRLVLSPMPGLLTQVVVEEGQEVKAGEPLAVVEAMKMENVLRAERDGRVGKLRAKTGDSLAVDQVILELE